MAKKLTGNKVDGVEVMTRTIKTAVYTAFIMDTETCTARKENFVFGGKATNSNLYVAAENACNMNDTEVIAKIVATGDTVERLLAITIADFMTYAFEVER